tara:strand:- start:45485 stop:46030 length:546 start_codon:yes stop_codon:yes gene_type:complete
MKKVILHDKTFVPYLSESKIKEAIQSLANSINNDYTHSEKPPVFISVLNGSFMFTADLLKEITIPCEVSFVKMASYQGTQSTGKVNELIGVDENLEGRDIILLEDIVDTGNTLLKLVDLLKAQKIKSLKICTLLFKPEPYHNQLPLDYIGIEIPNKFVVGYGLDYDNLGRNLKEIYVLTEN